MHFFVDYILLKIYYLRESVLRLRKVFRISFVRIFSSWNNDFEFWLFTFQTSLNPRISGILDSTLVKNSDYVWVKTLLKWTPYFGLALPLAKIGSNLKSKFSLSGIGDTLLKEVAIEIKVDFQTIKVNMNRFQRVYKYTKKTSKSSFDDVYILKWYFENIPSLLTPQMKHISKL